MSEELISKKELLELKGITYGQLYRWKRKNLIPEDWFIRKSTFTGQETFFPKEKILQRIDRIINMKEDLSLTDLADVFSPGMPGISERKDVLVSKGVISIQAMEIYLLVTGKGDVLDFNGMLIAYAAEKLLASGDATIDEAKLAIETLEANYDKFGGKSCELVVMRKLGVAVCAVISGNGAAYFDKNMKIISRLPMLACAEELKMKL